MSYRQARVYQLQEQILHFLESTKTTGALIKQERELHIPLDYTSRFDFAAAIIAVNAFHCEIDIKELNRRGKAFCSRITSFNAQEYRMFGYGFKIDAHPDKTELVVYIDKFGVRNQFNPTAGLYCYALRRKNYILPL